MDVAQVCIRFGAPGGAEAHVRALAERLAKRGHRVTVVTSDLYAERPWRQGGAWEPVPAGVEVVRLPIRPKRPLVPLAMAGLRRALRDLGPDIVHAHSHRYQHTRVAASVARERKAPFCMTPHYHPIEAGDALWKHVAARGLDAYDSRAVYGRAARVFAVTKLEATLLAERRIAEGPRVRILPNGIDLERWKSPPREDIVRRRLGFDGPYVLYAGRLASNKGLDVLLRAWSSMTPDQKQGSALVLAGADWGVRSALEKTAGSLGIRAEVRFAGHLAEEEYRSAVAHAELLVLPSEWEAFGIVLLEAMAAGRPVVATRVGGVPEVVTDGQDGLLVPYGDTEALASAIARVLGDPDLAGRLRAAGPAKARGYDWHSIVGRLESEYRELLGERSPSRDAPAVAA